jgi:glycosyltransferase involved in cell wall biosynthesis
MALIVHASETLATGVLSVLSVLTRSQAQDGHDVVVIGSRLRTDTPAGWRDELHSSVRFIDLPMEREITWRADLRSALRMRAMLRALAPDVVHLHSSKAGAVGRFAALGLRTRLIYQPHGLASLRRDVSRARRAIFASIEAALALLGGTVVACSEGEHAALCKLMRGDRAALVCNGIDVSRVPRARAEKGRLKIGMCGRISAQKRPLFFAEVSNALRDVADFVWIGDGDDEEGREALLAAGVRITGWCTRTDALKELSALHIYIQTSAWEGLPISVIEALAAGLPVVATNIIGNRDLLLGTGTGELVDTPAQMITALRALIDDKKRRVRTGLAARRLAHERYSSAAMMRGYYQLYGFA